MPSRFLCVARATASASKPLKVNIPSTIPRCPDLSFDRDVMLPPLAQCTHFVNLTNGLEAVPHLHALRVNYQIVRFQSTYCEQQKFEDMVEQADASASRCRDSYKYLRLPATITLRALWTDMSADGIGSRSHVRASALQCSSSQLCYPIFRCLVWDYGCRSNHGCSRAIWYGLEFLRFATTRVWLRDRVGSASPRAILRGKDVSKRFEYICRNFGKTAKKKLRYYKKFVPDDVNQLALYGVYRSTQHDGEEDFYRDIADTYLRPVSPQNSMQRTQNFSQLRAEHDARILVIPRFSETPSERASLPEHAALASWNSLLEDSSDSCSSLSSKAANTPPAAQPLLHSDLRRPSGSLSSRISSASEWEKVRNELDAAQSLSMLGFHVFHGGLSPAGYENYQSALATARKQQQMSV